MILNAYIYSGEKSVLKNLMACFLLPFRVTKKKHYFLARDRYGIKPLYYQTNDCFLFASEINAIIASGLYGTKINKEAFVEYLTFQNFFTDRTLFKDICVMPAGHFMMVKRENLSLYKY